MVTLSMNLSLICHFYVRNSSVQKSMKMASISTTNTTPQHHCRLYPNESRDSSSEKRKRLKKYGKKQFDPHLNAEESEQYEAFMKHKNENNDEDDYIFGTDDNDDDM